MDAIWYPAAVTIRRQRLLTSVTGYIMVLDEHATSDDGGSEVGAVVADDALLGALGGGANPARSGAADVVTCMLAAWRRDVDSGPIPRLVDIDTALTLVGHRPHKSVVDWAVDVFLRR
jgi:hypothetical protein